MNDFFAQPMSRHEKMIVKECDRCDEPPSVLVMPVGSVEELDKEFICDGCFRANFTAGGKLQ